MPVIVPANHTSADSHALTSPPENSVEQNDGSLSISASGNFDLRDIRKQIQSGAQARGLAIGSGSSVTASGASDGAQQEKDPQPTSSTARPQSNDWEAKNKFAAATVGLSGISGMNAGHVNFAQKPAEMSGLATVGVSISHESVRYVNSCGSLSAASVVANNGGVVTRVAGTELLQTIVGRFTQNSLDQSSRVVLEQRSDLSPNEVMAMEDVSVVQVAEKDISQGSHVVISEKGNLASSSTSEPEGQQEAEGVATGAQRAGRPVIGTIRKALHVILRGGRD